MTVPEVIAELKAERAHHCPDAEWKEAVVAVVIERSDEKALLEVAKVGEVWSKLSAPHKACIGLIARLRRLERLQANAEAAERRPR